MPKKIAVYWNNKYIGEAHKIYFSKPGDIGGIKTLAIFHIVGNLQIERRDKNVSHNRTKRIRSKNKRQGIKGVSKKESSKK